MTQSAAANETTQNGDTNLGFPTLKKLELIEFDFDDTGVGGDFHFYMMGLSRLSFTDTEPTSTGTYTETYKAKIGSMTGEGSDQNAPFVIPALFPSPERERWD